VIALKIQYYLRRIDSERVEMEFNRHNIDMNVTKKGVKT